MELQGGTDMSEDRSNGENNNDVFANNRGVVKSWKSLVLIIVGFFGFIFAMTAFSAIPSLKWLTPALFGLLFFVVGIVFLKMSKTSYNLPLIAMLIGTLLMYIAIFDKYFPDIRDTIGDKISGAVMILFGIIMLVYPFAVVAHYKRKYNETVLATVIHVETHFSRGAKSLHSKTFRPIYQFTYLGKEYTVTDAVYSSGNHPSTGEERDLLIDANNPEHFFDLERMKELPPTRFIAPVILFALGIYLIVAG